MARFFITGSSDGLGLGTAKRLLAQGHSVVLHARSAARAAETHEKCPNATAILVADLTSIDETKALAAEANTHGPFDGVVHNAGLYTGAEKIPGKSGLPSLFAVNTLAPYLLASLMDRPKRLLFVSSQLHRGATAKSVGTESEADLTGCSYADSKAHNIMLANAFARRWPDVQSNSADPGWVPTKMGGAQATDSLDAALDTFVMGALGEGAAKGKTAAYLMNSSVGEATALALDEALGEELVKRLEKMTGVKIPE